MHHSTIYVKNNPLPTYAELDEMILSTQILASNLIELLGIPDGFKQDAYKQARDMAQGEKSSYNTEIQLQCHFWQGTHNGPDRSLFAGDSRKSTVASVNHRRRTHYTSAFAPIMRVAELEVLRDEFFDISLEKAAADQAALKLRAVFSAECSNFWVRNGASIVSDSTSKPFVTTTAKEAGYQNIRAAAGGWVRTPLWRCTSLISIDHNYMTEVTDRSLNVVKCNGKTGFPLSAKAIPLPKNCDPSYELYAAKVVVIYSNRVDGAESREIALTGFNSEDRYICVGVTNGGERIVSCSTTPGRAVGGVNVRTKNKVLDTLDFSF